VNLVHTHSFVLPIGPMLLLIAAVGACVVAVRVFMLMVGGIGFWLVDRFQKKQADEILDRLGAVPRDVRDHLGGVNGVRPARVKEL
jgi:hypothetical protein